MKFSKESSIPILSQTPAILKTFVGHLGNEWTSVNESGDSWSVYDIIGHLIHGEITDWIPRAKIILYGETPKQFEPFDRFAQFELSKGKSLFDLLQEFEELRAKNINELEQLPLTEENLELKGLHPELGTVTLSQLLAAWVTHDLGHISQIARVMAKQYKDEVGPWTDYIPILKK